MQPLALQHIAVIGSENKDGVVGLAGRLHRVAQLAHAIVQRRHVRVVAAQILHCFLRVRGRHVGAQLEFAFAVEGLILLRRGAVGVVGRTQ